MPIAHRIGSLSSLDRLERLIQLRLEPGADKQAVDQRIWDLFGERWAVMFTDLSGFSRQVAEFGIIHFLQVIYESERLLFPCIQDHDGILLKEEGDSLLVIFRSAKRALDCSVCMQRILHGYNKDKHPNEQVLLCVGLGFGDILRIGDAEVFGAEVNAASKLGEDTAKANEILVTGNLVKEVGKGSEYSFEDIDYVPPGADAAFRVKYSL